MSDMKFLSVDDVASIAGIPKDQVESDIENGKLRVVDMVPGHPRVSLPSVAAHYGKNICGECGRATETAKGKCAVCWMHDALNDRDDKWSPETIRIAGRKYLSINGAASETGLTVERIRELVESGHLPHTSSEDGTLGFVKSTLNQWVRDNLTRECAGRALEITPRVVRVEAVDACDMPLSIRGVQGLIPVSLPDHIVGIYFLCRDGEVMYVGKSVNAVSRAAAHSERWSWTHTFIFPCPRSALDETEKKFIRELQPPWNKVMYSGAV